MEKNSQIHDSIYSQIEEEYGKATYAYEAQIIHAGRLQKRDHCIKIMQIVFSAISTSGFIGTIASDNTKFIWLTGIFSIALLIISAYSKDADLSELQKEHKITSDKILDLRYQYVSLLIESKDLSLDELKMKRDNIHDKLMDVYKSAPMTDLKSFKKAQDFLKNKEGQFFSREELNKMLPENLRK